MVEKAAELVYLRNEFYRDNYHRVFMALLAMIAVNFILIGIVYYQITHRPLPQYFAITADGKIARLQSLSQPVMGPDAILAWANRVAVSVHSYNFVNWREALQDVQNNFTSAGWANFEEALKISKNLETVLAQHLVVHAVATGTPIIKEKGVVDGKYMWKIQIPLLVTYEGATVQNQQPVLVSMIVSRVSPVNFPQGIAVTSFVESETGVS